MDEYLQKYLDGDLTDAEAEIFSRALQKDPELEAELRTYERMLAEAESVDRDPGPQFSDGVMERVEHIAAAAAAESPDRSGAWRRTWMMRAATAAGLAAVFVAGYLVPRPSPETALPGAAIEATAIAPMTMRLARLVYVPADPDVDEVTVAGTFNGWNPEQTTMTRRGDAWVVEILLPPQTYEYMFVENGQRWVTDPLALQTRDDGFGRKNAVLDLEI